MHFMSLPNLPKYLFLKAYNNHYGGNTPWLFPCYLGFDQRGLASGSLLPFSFVLGRFEVVIQAAEPFACLQI